MKIDKFWEYCSEEIVEKNDCNNFKAKIVAR